MKLKVLKFVVLGLTLVVLVGAIGASEAPISPAPPPVPELPALDLANATFSQYSPEHPFGGWFIPVKGFSDIMNTPPSKDTLIGIMLIGPKLAEVYFRVEKGIAYVTARIPFEPDPGIWFTGQARWVGFAKGEAGEIRFVVRYPPTILKKPWWWPDDFEFGHKPDCTWYGKITWER